MKANPSKRVEFIRKHYPGTYNRKECCDFLGISEEFFDAICEHNGIEKQNVYWEDWQVEYLLDNYQTMRHEEIARSIKRTRHSVCQKLYQLNVNRKAG